MYSVENLTLEITRKCNLKCEHCLRGNAQNKSMSDDVIHSVFNNIKHVNLLTLGGGEPSLAVDVIEKIYQKIMWCNISVDNIFLVTNGKTINKKLLIAFSKLYSVCASNEVSGFGISNDEFHQRARGFHRFIDDYIDAYYALCADESSNIRELSIAQIREHTGKKSTRWFARGRAKDFGTNTEPYLDNLKLNNLTKPTEIYGDMYVCYNGDVVGDCNMPYLDMKKYSRGNVLDWNALINNLKQSTIENYVWCLKNCKCSSPDPSSNKFCSDWGCCSDACKAIKKFSNKKNVSNQVNYHEAKDFVASVK